MILLPYPIKVILNSNDDQPAFNFFPTPKRFVGCADFTHGRNCIVRLMRYRRRSPWAWKTNLHVDTRTKWLKTKKEMEDIVDARTKVVMGSKEIVQPADRCRLTKSPKEIPAQLAIWLCPDRS